MDPIRPTAKREPRASISPRLALAPALGRGGPAWPSRAASSARAFQPGQLLVELRRGGRSSTGPWPSFCQGARAAAWTGGSASRSVYSLLHLLEQLAPRSTTRAAHPDASAQSGRFLPLRRGNGLLVHGELSRARARSAGSATAAGAPRWDSEHTGAYRPRIGRWTATGNSPRRSGPGSVADHRLPSA